MIKLTIFTPTYNRAYVLQSAYNSLLEQTNQEFEWIIVDDGSTDNTENLVQSWKKEDKIKILYYKQPNSGKHIAHNLGMNLANGYLFTCLDSDDVLLPTAVENILKSAEQLTDENCGILGLDIYNDGSLVGNEFPNNVNQIFWNELNFTYNLKGDKTIVFITDVLRKYPFPENSDKHMPPSYQLFLMSGEKSFVIQNTPMKKVEYLPDGITNNIQSQYKKAPNNYMLYRLMLLKQPNTTLKFRIKTAILYHVAKCYSNKESKIEENSLLLTITKPIGKFYYKILNRKV